MKGSKPIPLNMRFWSKVNVGDENECWNWTASVDTRGYGHIGAGPGLPLARSHRVAYELFHSVSIPKDLVILHTCDNRKCCNPYHLALGTQRDNVRDMVAKERNADYSGAKNPNAKLNQEKADAIRADTRHHSVITAEYRISKTTYYGIKNGSQW